MMIFHLHKNKNSANLAKVEGMESTTAFLGSHQLCFKKSSLAVHIIVYANYLKIQPALFSKQSRFP